MNKLNNFYINERGKKIDFLDKLKKHKWNIEVPKKHWDNESKEKENFTTKYDKFLRGIYKVNILLNCLKKKLNISKNFDYHLDVGAREGFLGKIIKSLSIAKRQWD